MGTRGSILWVCGVICGSLGSDDMYLHFLKMVYKMAKSAIIMRMVIIQALIWAAIFCFPSTPLSPQFGGKVGSWKLNLFG